MARSTAKAGKRKGGSSHGGDSTDGSRQRGRDIGPEWLVPAGCGMSTESSSSRLQGAARGQ